jgi:hypothetical protein
VIAAALATAAASPAQNKYNAYTQINWVPLSGSGAPTLPCNSTYYGMQYVDITNQQVYACASGGWFKSTQSSPIIFVGAWSSTVTYSMNQAVGYNGNTYVSLQNNNLNQNPATQTNYWMLLIGPGGGVQTFNGRTGNVTLQTGDVNAVGTISNSTTGNAATATALATTPTPCSGSQLAGGVDAHGNSINCATAGPSALTLTGDVTGTGTGTVATSVVKVNGAAVPASKPALGSNSLGQLIDGTAGISTALNTGPGLFIGGDSIACGSFLTTTAQSAWSFNLRTIVGGVWSLNCRPGDQLIDTTSVYMNPAIAPTADGHSPLVVIEPSTNDVTNYGASTDLENSFQGMYAAAVYLSGIPISLQLYPATSLTGWTPTGTWAADATQQNIFPDYVSTTNGNTLAYAATCAASCVGVLEFPVWNANGGTFTVSLNGTPIANPYGGGTTFYNAGFNGATITAGSSTASTFSRSAVRVPMSAGSNTITVTVTSSTSGSNKVGVSWFGIVPIASIQNPPVEAMSTLHRDDGLDTLSGIYTGLISSVITQAATDGLNAYYANTRDAMLNTNVAVKFYTPAAGTTFVPTGWVSDQGVSYAVTSTPLVLVGSSPAQGQYAESAGTYTFNVADSATPLNVSYTINCGANQTAMFANCYANSLHPNNYGDAVMAAVAASSIPQRYVTGNNVPQSNYPYRNYVSNGVAPNQMMSPNAGGIPEAATPTNGLFVPGINFLCNVNQCYFETVTGNGLETYLPNIGGGVVWSLAVYTSSGGQPTPNTPTQLMDTLTGNGVRTWNNVNSIVNSVNNVTFNSQFGNTRPSFGGAYMQVNDYSYFYPGIPTVGLANLDANGETGLRFYGQGTSALQIEMGLANATNDSGDGACALQNVWYLSDFTSGSCAIRAQMAANGVFQLNVAARVPSSTVAALPSATTLGAGAIVLVTDANSFTGGTCTGGGTDLIFAVSDGSAWVCQ